MRDVLFRAKRIDNGEWIYWDKFGRITTADGKIQPLVERKEYGTNCYNYIHSIDVDKKTCKAISKFRIFVNSKMINKKKKSKIIDKQKNNKFYYNGMPTKRCKKIAGIALLDFIFDQVYQNNERCTVKESCPYEGCQWIFCGGDKCREYIAKCYLERAELKIKEKKNAKHR